MGTTLAVSVSSPSRDQSLQAIDSAFAAVHRIDDVLNDWRNDTDIARLNRAAPGEPVPLDSALGGFLCEVTNWTQLSGGAFDPGIGALVDAWDLRGAGRIPTDQSMRDARAASGLLLFTPAVEDDGRHLMRRPASTSWIDAGGFGKGAALRTARDQLRKAHVRAAIFNFGGQVVVMGDTTLVVDVAHPRDRSKSVAQLRLYEASASTTSQSERSVEISGRRLGHVLDPRNGMPVPDWGSVTVVHSDPMLADILSTALFVMGPDEGLRWAEGQGVAALFLVPRDRLVQPLWSSPMRQLIISHPPIIER
jgi:thiamine biosynthesis lipoprotein